MQIFGLQEVMIWDQFCLTPNSVLTLLDATWLDELEGLVLCGAWLQERALKAPASSSRLARLHSASIRPAVSSWSGDGMRALLHSPHPGGLKLLNIAQTALDPEIVALLARPDVLPGLETLVVTFDDKKDRDLLVPRFGKGRCFGSMESDDQFDEQDDESTKLLDSA